VEHLTVEHGDRVSTIALSSAPANALSEPLLAELRGALNEIGSSAARVLVIHSALERFFAAGADLKLIATLDRSGFAAYLERLRGVVRQIESLPQVTIAAIDGMALGGGLELALACTLRLASPRARLGVPEVRLGLHPGAFGTQRLPAVVGRARAVEMLLSGRDVDGQEAATIGLVDRLHEAPLSAAGAWAQELAVYPRSASAAIRRCVRAADESKPGAGEAVELEEILALFGEVNAREGIAAFLERRRPVFPEP
jgi:enoyl-CoA hydratase